MTTEMAVKAEEQVLELKEKLAAFQKDKEKWEDKEASKNDKIHVLVERNKEWQEKTTKVYKEIRQNQLLVEKERYEMMAKIRELKEKNKQQKKEM